MSELDERRVLDAMYGDSERPRWHYVVSDKDFEEFELPQIEGRESKEGKDMITSNGESLHYWRTKYPTDKSKWWKEEEMSEISREQHINNLYDLRDEILRLMPNNKEDREKYVQSVVYAINSLEVDEAYQLEYEHIPFITLDELKEIRGEMFSAVPYNEETFPIVSKIFYILDKKISELEGKAE